MEEDLVEDKEVRHEVREIIGLFQAQDNAVDGEQEYHVSDSGGILGTPVSAAQFYLKLAISENARSGDKPIRANLPRFGEEELDITPNDLKHRHLIRLYECERFEERNLKLVAAICIQGISDPKTIAGLVPHLTGAEFSKLRGRVYRMVEDTLPEKTKRFIKFWNDALSEKQREALRLVFMNNDDKLTKKEIASKLDIAVDSLNNRLEGVIPKLRGLLADKAKGEKLPEKIRGLWKIPDAQLDGLYYRSEAKKIRQLIDINPRTGARTVRDLTQNPFPAPRPRKNVDVNKVRAWARGYWTPSY